MADPLGLLQLQEVTGEQEGKRLGVGGAPPSGTKGVSAKTAASPLPRLQPAGSGRAPSVGTWLLSPTKCSSLCSFLVVNLFPALFPP